MTVTVTVDDAPADAPPPPPPAPTTVVPASPVDLHILDDPTIGGRFTVFMLLYGDYPDMHREALSALLSTTTADRIELRVASNQLGPASLALVDHFQRQGRISYHDRHLDNDRKYPVMRGLFHDPARPITTPYIIWFDDDSICTDPLWLQHLGRAIVAGHPQGARLFGPHYSYALQPGQVAWIRAAPWYRGRPFQDAAGREAPNGQRVHFATGSFWALATEVIGQQDIPDARLGHNGGDWTIGAQVHQGGWKLHPFSTQKQLVRWSAYSRRGLSEPHPGLAPI